MHLVWFSALLPQLVIIIGLVIIGVVMAPRAGDARGRLGTAIAVLVGAQLVSGALTAIAVSGGAVGFGYDVYAIIAAVVNVVTLGLIAVGVWLLVSAAGQKRGV